MTNIQQNVRIGNGNKRETIETTVYNIHRHPLGAIWGEIIVDGETIGVALMDLGKWVVRGGEIIPERYR